MTDAPDRRAARHGRKPAAAQAAAAPAARAQAAAWPQTAKPAPPPPKLRAGRLRP